MKFSRVSDFLARDEASANFDANIMVVIRPN